MALPNSAADPREGGKPAYIAADCPTCNTKLVLLDHIEHPSIPEDQIWHMMNGPARSARTASGSTGRKALTKRSRDEERTALQSHPGVGHRGE